MYRKVFTLTKIDGIVNVKSKNIRINMRREIITSASAKIRNITKLKSIEIENIKNVKKGKIVFRKDGKPIYDNDIIGLYGQNGSGKSAMVSAFKILKNIFMSKNVNAKNILEYERLPFYKVDDNFDSSFNYLFNETVENENDTPTAKIDAVFEVLSYDLDELDDEQKSDLSGVKPKTFIVEYICNMSCLSHRNWTFSGEELYIKKLLDDGSWSSKTKIYSFNPEKDYVEKIKGYKVRKNFLSKCASTEELNKLWQFKSFTGLKLLFGELRESFTNYFYSKNDTTFKTEKTNNPNIVGDNGITIYDTFLCFNELFSFGCNMVIRDNLALTSNDYADMIDSVSPSKLLVSSLGVRDSNALLPFWYFINNNEVFDRKLEQFNYILNLLVPDIKLRERKQPLVIEIDDIISDFNDEEEVEVISHPLKLKNKIRDYVKEKIKLDAFSIWDNKFNKFYEAIALVVLKIWLGPLEQSDTLQQKKKKLKRAKPLKLMVVEYEDENGTPLLYLSEGIKKFILWIDGLIRFYNNPDCLCVIDEFDSGIFEYLLGELLLALNKGGKGQLFFTSHNLRPLEVLPKEKIYFTTTNPYNRYIQLKNIKSNHNLRDRYLQAVMLGGQKEELYCPTNLLQLSSAFYKAGGVSYDFKE